MLKWIVLCVYLDIVLSQEDANPCITAEAQKSCAACIAIAKQCGWCIAENYLEENRRRCDTYENHARGRCDRNLIQFPNDEIRNVEDREVQDGDSPADAVQIQPQHVRVRMRPNKPVRIPLIFRQAANYPVDLYYLMDLSKSMDEDKENLAELGNLIADRMSAITQNFRLGFGSFIDKVVSPYVSIVPSKLKVPCKVRLTGMNCVAPYGFRNHLSLDLETSRFAKKVRESPISGNLDAPEGGFDAIMQAVVCENEIGWRTISRRMLVFSTDAGFHYAGDGKLGGIVQPNDGSCHMENDEYTESSHQDYPSVSQISNKIKEKSVSIIFAVTKEKFPVYEKLSQYIDSSATGILANDSSNIVNLIQENYERITSKVKLRTENVDDNITVEFFSRCFGSEEKKTDECGSLKIGQSVTFDVEVTATGCPKDRKKWKQEFFIKPAGYQESVKVVLDLICECECEKPENEDPYSSKCSNGSGTYECGICNCNPGYYGDVCECKSDDVTTKESVEQCIGPNSTRVCSGRGVCQCGKCKCNPRVRNLPQTFSGKFCECDDYSCNRHLKQLCGGPERGTCNCGTCDCNEGYNGTACECELSLEKCTTASGKVCNDHGDCRCGKCECESSYSGLRCEQCLNCPDKCAEYSMCIHCRVLDNGKYTKEECDKKCPDLIPDTKKIEESPEVQACQLEDDEGCFIEYSYTYTEEGKLYMEYEDPKICPESVNVLAIVGGVVGGIVAVGLLLLLIWKLFTVIHDRREFAKFEEERQNAKWDTGENPIYKQATSTFKNPTYGAH